MPRPKPEVPRGRWSLTLWPTNAERQHVERVLAARDQKVATRTLALLLADTGFIPHPNLLEASLKKYGTSTFHVGRVPNQVVVGLNAGPWSSDGDWTKTWSVGWVARVEEKPNIELLDAVTITTRTSENRSFIYLGAKENWRFLSALRERGIDLDGIDAIDMHLASHDGERRTVLGICRRREEKFASPGYRLVPV